MSPTIYREGPYRFFFFSREEERMHVHIYSGDGEAKFWLEPIVSLATYVSLKQKQLKKLQNIIEEHKDEFISEWHAHFPGSN